MTVGPTIEARHRERITKGSLLMTKFTNLNVLPSLIIGGISSSALNDENVFADILNDAFVEGKTSK